MEIIALKQRMDVVEAALAKILKQPAPEPSVKTGPAEAPQPEQVSGDKE